MTVIWDRRSVPALAKPALRLFERDVLTAYQDGGGVWTIATGSTVMPNGHCVQRGDRVTQAQSDAMLDHELLTIRIPAVLRAVPASVPLAEATVVSLISFVYEIGTGGLAAGNVITDMLAAGLIERALAQLLGWCIATEHGVRGPSLGVLRRRQVERLSGMGAPLQATYDQVWRLGMTELLPLYHDACTDAAAYRHGIVTWEVHPVPLPAAHPAPIGKPVPVRPTQQSEADALDDQFNPQVGA